MRAVSIDRKVVRFVIHEGETEPTAQGPTTFESPLLVDALTPLENCVADQPGIAPRRVRAPERVQRGG